jgi:hypothetical protein
LTQGSPLIIELEMYFGQVAFNER